MRPPPGLRHTLKATRYMPTARRIADDTTDQGPAWAYAPHIARAYSSKCWNRVIIVQWIYEELKKNIILCIRVFIKCCKTNYCTSFNALLLEKPNVNETHFKAYDKNSSFYGGLNVPPESFSNYIE